MVLKAIANLKFKGVDLMGFCKKVIGNGNNTSFWHEKWFGDECFKVRFNRLYSLDLQKDSSVAQKMQNSDWANSFPSDRWAWSLNGKGVFSVKSAREEIDKHLLVTSSSPTRWSNLLPIKFNIFSWRMFLDKLPTRVNLSNRGLPGFDDLVMKSWNSFVLDDSNGEVTDDIVLSRMEVLKQLHDVQSSNNRDIMQKAKIRWAIEGDENSKYFHAIINKKHVNLSVKGVMVDGDWIDDPDLIKQEFRSYFTDRFQDPGSRRGSLNFLFPNRLSNDQILDLESLILKDEIRTAVWGCGVDKSP
nr:RNA-directed DNA polymerase, eukaryota, reverse transcriptase zinc-binding domain protein [Tanacetum cinerariifolium]